MDRNAPCPCGSGRKFKKCHGGALPPEAATLHHSVRASVQRAESVLQRNLRITQDILDWADRRLTPEWMNKAYDAWGLGVDDELLPEEGDLFTPWAVYHFASSDADGPVGVQWLTAQQARHGARTDADTVGLVQAHRSSTLGVWEVLEAEPGVGLSLKNRLVTQPGESELDQDVYVYETDASHELDPGRFVLAYVAHVDDVRVFVGLHDALLEPPEIDAVLSAVVPGDTLLTVRQHWAAAAERYYDRLDAEAADDRENSGIHDARN